MRIEHLNCISSCPLGGALMDGRSLGLRGRLTCHFMLIETSAGLVLVDTRSRLSHFFLALLSPDFRDELTAIRQIEALGYDSRDVRHIVLTHLDSITPVGWTISRTRRCICSERNGRSRRLSIRRWIGCDIDPSSGRRATAGFPITE